MIKQFLVEIKNADIVDKSETSESVVIKINGGKELELMEREIFVEQKSGDELAREYEVVEDTSIYIYVDAYNRIFAYSDDVDKLKYLAVNNSEHIESVISTLKDWKESYQKDEDVSGDVEDALYYQGLGDATEVVVNALKDFILKNVEAMEGNNNHAFIHDYLQGIRQGLYEATKLLDIEEA